MLSSIRLGAWCCSLLEMSLLLLLLPHFIGMGGVPE